MNYYPPFKTNTPFSGLRHVLISSSPLNTRVLLANTLRVQIEAAEVIINETEKDAAEHSENLLLRARSFQRDQVGIDRRVEVILASEEMKDIARRAQASMGRLQQLEVAKSYIQLIQIVHSLRYARVLAFLNSEKYFLMLVQ